MNELEKIGFYKSLKLTSSLTTSNMVLFDANHKLRKYNQVEDIIKEFYTLRYLTYQKRKNFLINQLKMEVLKLTNKARFIQEVCNGSFIIQNRKKDILKDLVDKKYDLFDQKTTTNATSTSSSSSDDNPELNQLQQNLVKGYHYLLSLSLWSLSSEKIENLLNEKDNKEQELMELDTY